MKMISRRHLFIGSTLSALALSAGLLFSGSADAAPGDHAIKVKALPKTVEDFLKLRGEIAKTPQGAAAAFVVAGILYSQSESLGTGALTTIIDSSKLTNGSKGYKGKQPGGMDMQRLKDRWSKARGYDYVPRSYVQGTSPEKQYKMPSGSFTIKVKEQSNSTQSDGSVKMYVYSTGADSARPIRLKKNSAGIWKAFEWSSLTSGVRKPAAAASDEI